MSATTPATSLNGVLTQLSRILDQLCYLTAGLRKLSIRVVPTRWSFVLGVPRSCDLPLWSVR